MPSWKTRREFLQYFRERSEDIAKVVIPQSPFITLHRPGKPDVRVDAAMIIHYKSGKVDALPKRADAEAILNDGILARMRIPIELGQQGERSGPQVIDDE
jgi:hypothetical protein